MLKKIIIPICVCIGTLAFLHFQWFRHDIFVLNGVRAGKLLLIAAIYFLGMGIYGLLSGRVYGRSDEKWWGGWLYRDSESKWYWQFVILDIVVGSIFLLKIFFCVFGGRL